MMCSTNRLLRPAVLLLLLVYGMEATAGFDKVRRAFASLLPGSIAAVSAYLIGHSMAPDLLDDGRADTLGPLSKRDLQQNPQRSLPCGDMPTSARRPSLEPSDSAAREVGMSWFSYRRTGAVDAFSTAQQRLVSLSRQTCRTPSGRRLTDIGLLAQKIIELEQQGQRLGSRLDDLSHTAGQVAVEVEQLLDDNQTLADQRAGAVSVQAGFEQQLNDLFFITSQQQAKTTDGHFIWRIPNVDQHFQNALEGSRTSIFSLPFYTSPHGYQLALRADLNGSGEGKGNYLSVFIVVMEGAFDALLEWPFKHRVRFYLRDQSPDVKGRKNHVRSIMPESGSRAFEQPVEDMNIAAGIPKFIPLSRLKPRMTGDQPDGESWFVFNNTMFLEAVVELDTPSFRQTKVEQSFDEGMCDGD